jgi:hypothetical protein
MRHLLFFLLLAALWEFDLALAQSSFPPQPVGLNEFFSKRWPGATISYKQVSKAYECGHSSEGWAEPENLLLI